MGIRKWLYPGQGEGADPKGAWEIWDDHNILYLNEDVVGMGMYSCQNIWNYTLKIYAFYGM